MQKQWRADQGSCGDDHLRAEGCGSGSTAVTGSVLAKLTVEERWLFSTRLRAGPFEDLLYSDEQLAEEISGVQVTGKRMAEDSLEGEQAVRRVQAARAGAGTAEACTVEAGMMEASAEMAMAGATAGAVPKSAEANRGTQGRRNRRCKTNRQKAAMSAGAGTIRTAEEMQMQMGGQNGTASGMLGVQALLAGAGAEADVTADVIAMGATADATPEGVTAGTTAVRCGS